MITCYLAQLPNLRIISKKAVAFDLSDKEVIIPISQIRGDIAKNGYYWVSDWICHSRKIPYKNKGRIFKDDEFDFSEKQIGIHRHVPKLITPKSENEIEELKK